MTTNGDYEVTFHLKQPQPALLALLASGWSPIYPCHVPAREMRQHPIGTGPFKFVEFKPNEYIKLTPNPDYWKPGRPYLDGIEYTIMREIAPRNLAFFAGKFDVDSPYGVTIPTLKDFKEQAPQAICEVTSANVPRTMLINRAQAAVRQSRIAPGDGAGARPQGVHRHHQRGAGRYRRRHAAAARTASGACRRRCCRRCPATVPTSRRTAPKPARSWRSSATDRTSRSPIKISTRNFPAWRDPAVILISQLKEIYIDAELELVDTAQWYPKMTRKDFTVGAVPIESGVDDPDQMFYENYVCGAARNYAGYSDPEFDKLIDQQSMEADPDKAQTDRLADRAQAGRGRRPAGALLPGAAAPAGSPGSRG